MTVRLMIACNAALTMATAALHAAGSGVRLTTGPFHPLDPDWGARVACCAMVATGLRNAARLHQTAENLRHGDPVEAAWWFGLMSNGGGRRAVRALRILIEAVP